MKKMLFILLGLASINTYGYDVTRGALQNNSALCGYGYNPNCGSSGHHQQRRTTEIINIDVPSRYGAWATNPKTSDSGGAIDMESLEAAKAQAIKTCERGGRNAPCKVYVWVRNGCIAVAQGKSGKKWKAFPSTQPGPGLAEADALRKCQESGSSQCSIFANEGCSLPKF
ncbi:DUF4189 domain-containing protein [Neisseria sp. P0019.S002]|jgi:hypothetical protein|uniref:DUF4189 domain-containing protein n=1 Tax=Neisseria sp. P0019.S002 TaxID=3436798 RepID=UPI003F7D6A5D